MCRVYLIGGADAKRPNDVVPVFTPATWVLHGTEKMLYAWNVTLPTGFFSAVSKNGMQIPSLAAQQ